MLFCLPGISTISPINRRSNYASCGPRLVNFRTSQSLVYRLRTCNTKRRHAETLSCFFWPAAAEEIDLLEHGVRRAGEDEASLARQFTKTPRKNSSASAHLLTPCPTPWLDLHAPANAPRSEIQGQACHHAHQVSESPPATPDIMLRQCWGVTASISVSVNPFSAKTDRPPGRDYRRPWGHVCGSCRGAWLLSSSVARADGISSDLPSLLTFCLSLPPFLPSSLSLPAGRITNGDVILESFPSATSMLEGSWDAILLPSTRLIPSSPMGSIDKGGQ